MVRLIILKMCDGALVVNYNVLMCSAQDCQHGHEAGGCQTADVESCVSQGQQGAFHQGTLAMK